MTKLKLIAVLLILSPLLYIAAQTAPPPATTAKPATTSTPAPPSGPTSIASSPAYTLTELQHAHLHEAQLQYFIAVRDLQKAGEDFNRTCAQAKTDNHWPEGLQCSVQDLSIVPEAKK